MKAADLTDAWIGRTVAVHHTRPPLVGRLTAVDMQYSLIPNHDRLHQAHAAGPVASVSLSLDQDGARVWTVVRPETVVIDQEVPWQ